MVTKIREWAGDVCRFIVTVIVSVGGVCFAAHAAPVCISETDQMIQSSAEEYVFEARIKRGRKLVGDAFLSYQLGGRMYFPLKTISLFLEYSLPHEKQLSQWGCGVSPHEALLRQDVFESILALQAQVDFARLEVQLASDALFPIEKRILSEKRRANIQHGQDYEAANAIWKYAPYSLFSPPALEITGQIYETSEEPGFNERYNLNWSGDLFKATARLQVSYDNQSEDQPVPGGYLQRRFLSNAVQDDASGVEVTLGDMPGFRDEILSRGRVGRGVSIGSVSQRYSGVQFDFTTLTGLLPEGWSVELLRRGVVIGVQTQSQNGRYQFEDVPLDYGRNDFVLNFFGPNGERRSERVERSIGGTRLRGGEFEFRVQAYQNDRGLDGRDLFVQDSLAMLGDWFQARTALGLGGEWAAHAEYARFNPRDNGTQARQFGALQLEGTPFANLVLTGRLLRDLEQESLASQFGMSARLLGFDVGVSHIDFDGIDTERSRYTPDERLEDRLSGSLARQQKLGQTNIYARVAASRERTQLGRELEAVDTNLSVSLDGWVLGHRGRWSSNTYLTRSTASFHRMSLRKYFGRLVLRADVHQRLKPEKELGQSFFTVDYRQSRAWQHRFQVQYEPSNDEARYFVNTTFSGNRLRVGAGINCADYGDCSVGLNFGFGLSFHPQTYRAYAVPPGYNAYGSVFAFGFRDADQDGEFDDFEEKVEDFQLSARRARQLTEKSLLLPPNRPVVVKVLEGSHDSPFLYARENTYRILPRSGRAQLIAIPMVETGEVEGFVFSKNGEVASELSGIRVQILDEENEIIREERSAYDGLFIIDRIPLGSYTLRLHPEDLEKLTLRAIHPVEFTLVEPGDLVKIGQLMLASDASYRQPDQRRQRVFAGSQKHSEPATNVADNARNVTRTINHQDPQYMAPPASGLRTLFGRVYQSMVGQSAIPMAGVRVSVVNTIGQTVGDVMSDVNGFYRLSVNQPGEYHLRVGEARSSVSFRSFIVPPGGRQFELPTILLSLPPPSRRYSSN